MYLLGLLSGDIVKTDDVMDEDYAAFSSGAILAIIDITDPENPKDFYGEDGFVEIPTVAEYLGE